jgi:hypothetical protein
MHSQRRAEERVSHLDRQQPSPLLIFRQPVPLILPRRLAAIDHRRPVGADGKRILARPADDMRGDDERPVKQPRLVGRGFEDVADVVPAEPAAASEGGKRE